MITFLCRLSLVQSKTLSVWFCSSALLYNTNSPSFTLPFSEKDIVRGRGGSPSRRGRAIPTLRPPPLLDKRRLLPAVKDGFLPLAEINSPTRRLSPGAQRTANDFLHGFVAALRQRSGPEVAGFLVRGGSAFRGVFDRRDLFFQSNI